MRYVRIQSLHISHMVQLQVAVINGPCLGGKVVEIMYPRPLAAAVTSRNGGKKTRKLTTGWRIKKYTEVSKKHCRTRSMEFTT